MASTTLPPFPTAASIPAERASPARIAALSALSLESPVLRAVLDAVEGYALVLSPERQILAANPELLEALGLEEGSSLQGLRPGEALACRHAAEDPAGCGGSRSCPACGALLAMLAAQASGEPVEGECLLEIRRDGVSLATEYRVRVSPVEVGGHPLLVVVLLDISDRKRRDHLESAFIHDLLNTVQGLLGLGEALERKGGARETAQGVVELTRRLALEIQSQRLLRQAEEGALALRVGELEVPELLEDLEALFRRHYAARERTLDLEPAPGLRLRSDRIVLLRVLTNLVKNALEATPPGGTVHLACRPEGPWVAFEVANPGVMPPEAARRVFQRGFSTKAEQGRGLGTYSARLFTEGYLGGRIAFESHAATGTCFRVRLPAQGPPPPAGDATSSNRTRKDGTSCNNRDHV